jgi:hypothetical protein
MVSFVVSGRKEPLVERACLQLWVARQIGGKLVTNFDAAPDAATSPENATIPSPSSRSPSVASTAMSPRPMPTQPRNSLFSMPDPFSTSPPGNRNSLIQPGRRHPSVVLSPSTPDPSTQGWYSRTGTSPPFGASPLGIHGGVGGSPTSPRPMGQYSFPGPVVNQGVPTPAAPQPRRPTNSTVPTPSSTLNGSRADRTLSISSNMSTTAVSTPSNSGSSGAHTVTVAVGANGTGYVHKKPEKPMLVLFTQDPQSGRHAFVTIDIDEETCINPERCNCRRSGRDGSSCLISAIERKKGDAALHAHRFEARNGDVDWNLARLAISRREGGGDAYEETQWRDVRRVSVMFPDPAARAKYSGTPNLCHCKVKKAGDLNKCLEAGHRGLHGEVQEYWRKQANESHQVRFESQQHVVKGQMQ